MKKTFKFCLVVVGLLTLTINGCKGNTSQSTTSSYQGSISQITTSSCEHDLKLLNCVQEPTEKEVGKGLFKCNKCNNEFEHDIPMLNEDNYTMDSIDSTCTENGSATYESETYGTYTVTKQKSPHTSYSGMCLECKEIINNLNFSPDNFVKISSYGYYPRLYVLNDGTWLCGFDTGEICVVRSLDEGKTWSEPVVASQHSDYVCANVAFYELDNGDILCSYRAIGVDSTSNKREIQCSISKDGGLTWSYHSTIEDNFELAKELGYTEDDAISAIQTDGRIGFFEPYFGIINDKLTVMYTDDFSTMLTNPRGSSDLNYETQHIISRTYDEDTNKWVDRNIVLDGTEKKQVGLFSNFSRDGMPVFDRLSTGQYVLVIEGTYRREKTAGSNPFIILLSYSNDGINWSTPKEVYIPKGFGTKAGAPYVCVTEDDRIIISFQTDEDSYAVNMGVGDNRTLMKTIISDGTPVDKLTRENFSEAVNVFGIRGGDSATWNSMYMHNNEIYCLSGVQGVNETTNEELSGIYMAKSEIPAFEHVATFEDKMKESHDYKFTPIKGSIATLESGWMKTLEVKTTIIFDEFTMSDEFSMDFIPYYAATPHLEYENSNGGIIFNYSDDGYYMLSINCNGLLQLEKNTKNKNRTLKSSKDLKEGYSRLNSYNLKVKIIDSKIECYVDDKLYIEYEDSSFLEGNKVGFYSTKSPSLFSNPKV